MRIEREAIQDHLWEEVRDLVEAFAWFLPAWVEVVRIGWRQDGDLTLEVRMEEEYRVAGIAVGDGWGRVPPEDRPRLLFHEFIHVHQCHLWEAFHALLRAVEPEAGLERWAREEARKASERCANDLERVLWERMKGWDRIAAALP